MSQTLLIADHDQDTVRALAGELSADGYPVATASAIEALALQLIDRRPDLVVLGDFAGPGAQARLLGELRDGEAPFIPAVADTPAIVLSEHHGELAVLRAFDAGGDDFIANSGGDNRIFAGGGLDRVLGGTGEDVVFAGSHVAGDLCFQRLEERRGCEFSRTAL